MQIKTIQQLNFKVNKEDHNQLINSFKDDYILEAGTSPYKIFKCAKHFQSEMKLSKEMEMTVNLMITAIETLQFSVDYQTTAIDTVHFIIDLEQTNLIVHIQFGGGLSRILIPKFIGRKYNNIEILRRIATNLSGQHNILCRVYL